MMKLPLTIRSTERVQRAAHGLMLRGDAAAWFRRIASWNIDDAAIRIHILPRGPNEPYCHAALITSTTNELAEHSLPDCCLPFGQIGNLWLPVDAELVPALTQTDLRELLVEEYTYVWQPQIGMVGFESDQILRLHELIELGKRHEVDWSRAMPGISFPSRLDNIQTVAPPNIQSILDEGRDGIGENADALDSLPPQDGEPQSGIAGAIGRGLRGAAGHLARGLANALPNGNESGWGDKLAQWANDNLGQISKDVLAARHRELHRLMKMLETNPDEGLRYALPMGKMDHRGLVDGGGTLSQRNVNFTLGGTGSGPASVWDMPFDYQQTLLHRYRELASREVQLGRYRRAAYIYAELLGDFNSAAAVLRSGCHFHEAAILYRDKLNQPLVAAECLEQSGLIADAIELYVAEDHYEKAGDLYQRMEQLEKAFEMYGQAVNRSLKQGDRLDAARIEEEKMNDPAAALATLERGWPASRQAEACLRGIFAHVGRYADHARARAWVSQLRNVAAPGSEAIAAKDVVNAISVLSEQVNGYPDRGIADFARDSTLTVASHHLQRGETSFLHEIMSAVTSLQPQDRLLKHDTSAFERRRQRKPNRGRPRKRKPKKNAIEKVNRFQLAEDVEWNTAVAHQGDMYFAGLRGGMTPGSMCHLIVVRADTHGHIHQPEGRPWVVQRHQYPQPISMQLFPSQDYLFVHTLGNEANTKKRSFPSTDLFPDTYRIGSLSTVTPATIGVSATATDDIWLISQSTAGTILTNVGFHGQVKSSSNPLDDVGGSIHIHARRREIFFSASGNLYMMNRRGTPTRLHQGESINQIVGSALDTRTRVAISSEKGAHVFWDENSGAHAHVAAEVQSPRLCFTRRGLLTVAGESELKAYRTQEFRCDFLGEVTLTSDEIVAVVDVETDGCVATVDQNGVVDVLRLND